MIFIVFILKDKKVKKSTFKRVNKKLFNLNKNIFLIFFYNFMMEQLFRNLHVQKFYSFFIFLRSLFILSIYELRKNVSASFFNKKVNIFQLKRTEKTSHKIFFFFFIIF